MTWLSSDARSQHNRAQTGFQQFHAVGVSTKETNWNSSRIEQTNCHTFQWLFIRSIRDEYQFVSAVDDPQKGPVHTECRAPRNICMQILEHIIVNGSVHTGCKQHQRVCI